MWNGLELWHASKYTTPQVIAYSASQVVSWIGALIHALGRRIFNDIPHWLKESEYVFSGAGLLGNDSVDKLRWEYDKPVELGDGAVDSTVADKTEVVKELTQSVADYTGEDLNPELAVEQYLHLQEKLQEMVKECGPGSVAITSLWEKAHSISAIYNGAKDLL
ncbi:hypothetical protein Pmar_PMAR011500 [Perkinsus marinus ATCC 50983]|uniref:Uncharacterized protein n=1 Tax=Perkinsus marinus (strain ATCC 50983 / TXsc) TaxID=423536 RepID=C5LBZ4_PERM5|nr:hypothetical protein Pmar_PMAR011500 [Perkinsus marinus ATCC 50983]EER05477.1 hypothetical protein Pmar_PMAR011500 [Perkinsus marinus ATCC 50983]|eukprot:XP_002773661.1 hypothetical protein Pmar_PMAR011500 [Perkinsus marinus ATCC 50983]